MTKDIADTHSSTTRVQMEFPEKSMSRLRVLKEKTEATSYAEVVKNALRLYEEVIAEYETGNALFLRGQDGSIREYKIFV